METQRPQEIKASHLARRAAVYLRQSSLRQVEENTGSTEYQRGQVQWALRYGWRDDQIDVLDADLGLSGSSSAHRTDYLRVVAAIRGREIGALFASDLTRLGRDATEWFRLLDLCRAHDVLLILDGKVYDIQDNGELLLTRLGAIIGEHENLMRRENMDRGRLAKASMGKAVTRPPAGYVRGPDGSWALDPDATVQAAVHAVFRSYLRTRTLYWTVVELKELGVKLPRRSARGLRWVEPQIGTIQHMIKHVAYKGAYRYRRTRADLTRPRFPSGQHRRRHSSPDEIIDTPNHHEPYVSVQQWNEIQDTLKRHAPLPDRRNPGPGSGLLQGLVRCAPDRNRAMATVYRARKRNPEMDHGYFCNGDFDQGGKPCGRAPGAPLDNAVRDAVFARLSTPRLEEIRQTLALAKADDLGELHRRRTELNRARQAVADLTLRYMNVNPANRLVATDLESRLEAAKREEQKLERIVATEPSAVTQVDESVLEEVIALCKDLPGLWNAPSTSNSDRKDILRILIKTVFVLDRDLERIRARIVWADDEPDTEIDAVLNLHGHRIARQLLDEGVSWQGVADRLNEMGIPTMQGRAWTAKTVFQIAYRRRKGSAPKGRQADQAK